MNIKLLKSNIDTEPFLKEIEIFLKENNWDDFRRRQLWEHENTLAIGLIYLQDFKVTTSGKPETNKNSKERIEISTLINCKYFKNTLAFLFDFEKSNSCTIKKASIVLLEPNKKVHPHIDPAIILSDKDRYHICLKTQGSLINCEDESITFSEGDMFWFDNKKVHSAENLGDEPRIHIIFDVAKNRPSIFYKIVRFLFKKNVSVYTK